ncbi:peptide ABC transporter permease [Betaproteobacteria bacterium SCGC AG-212-J23]|nr:peptide ABC transporter permease [Betaproteobacteria bacterium SCGC AG-212-J23]
MPFKPVLLWTDLLLWLLVAGTAIYVWYCYRRPHLAAPWGRVFQSRTAIASTVVLAAFVGMTLADSLHFRPRIGSGSEGAAQYSNEVLSVLDVAFAYLRERRERTYSAPLATRLYAKDQIESSTGAPTRDYPKLTYGGAHLQDESAHGRDIALRAGLGASLAVAAAFLLSLLRRRLSRWRPNVPWSAGLWTFAVLLLLTVPLLVLSTGYHVFGTDKVGQDVFYQSLKSIRTALVIATLSTVTMLPFGVLFGIVAGYFRGWIDDVIQYLYTTLNSIPGVLLIAAAVLMMQVYIDTHPQLFPTAADRADVRLLLLCIILGVTSWTGLTRLLRGETLKLSQLEYIQAAHAFGVSSARILGRHILPNVAHIVIITLVMDFSGLVLAEAVLSYVGVGVDPATISFGTMINAARLEMGREPIVWWSLAAAFAFMLVLVLAANLLADAVRDGFDPRVRVGSVPV